MLENNVTGAVFDWTRACDHHVSMPVIYELSTKTAHLAMQPILLTTHAYVARVRSWRTGQLVSEDVMWCGRHRFTLYMNTYMMIGQLQKIFNPPPQFSRLGVPCYIRLFVWAVVGWVTLPFFSLCFLNASVLCTCVSMDIHVHVDDYYMYIHCVDAQLT